MVLKKDDKSSTSAGTSKEGEGKLPPTESTKTAVDSKMVSQHVITKVIVHPLVLLSAVDHNDRVLRDRTNDNSRVVGVLLGSLRGGILDISNCFAIPFEEDYRDQDVWFFDHDYLESMFAMFRKVNAREKIVGWYHTGKRLHKNDIVINEVLRKYNPHSVLVRIRTHEFEPGSGIPVEAFYAVDEVHDDGTPTTKTFEHLSAEIDAEEAEEVGVEHLLRDIKDSTASTLTQKVVSQLEALSGLSEQLLELSAYLEKVKSGGLPVNHQVLYHLQDMVNLLPDVSVEALIQALHTQTNDQMTVVYICVLIRSVLALHDLIKNKLANREAERTDMEETASSAATVVAATGDQKSTAAKK